MITDYAKKLISKPPTPKPSSKRVGHATKGYHATKRKDKLPPNVLLAEAYHEKRRLEEAAELSELKKLKLQAEEHERLIRKVDADKRRQFAMAESQGGNKTIPAKKRINIKSTPTDYEQSF